MIQSVDDQLSSITPDENYPMVIMVCIHSRVPLEQHLWFNVGLNGKQTKNWITFLELAYQMYIRSIAHLKVYTIP